jgi:hypothetical protein
MVAQPPWRGGTAIECLEKARAVLGAEGGIVALAFAGLAQMGAEIAHGARHADIGVVEDAAGRAGDLRAGRDTAHGERHVGGDDDVAGATMFGDPVVGGIEAVGDDDVVDHRIARGRRPELATKVTSMPRRSATLRTSGFTGQASAST